jgi:asparagine synthase (glutamine-hydrolysing)
MKRIPRPLRRMAAAALTAVPVSSLERVGGWLGRPRLGDRLHKGADLLACRDIDELYRGMVSHWTAPASVVAGLTPHEVSLPGADAAPLDGLGDIERMMARDMTNYLPDDILVKVDRAAMGVSLETRVPMLDHRVVEFAWRLPLEYKLRDGVTKWVLREVLYRHVPRQLIERPKMGFGVPIDRWLRGPLREWAETLLDESRLRREGYFHPAPVRKRWAEHLSGQRNWQYHLWDLLVAQSWLEAQREPAVAI